MLSILAFAAALVVNNSQTTVSLQNDFHTQRNWHVTQRQKTDNAQQKTELCFWISSSENENCFSLVPPQLEASQRDMQVSSTLKVIHIPVKGQSIALLRAEARFSQGGSGYLRQTAFWLYDGKADDFLQAASVTLTEQGEYQIVTGGDLSGTLLTAEANIEAGEAHFSPHHFHIVGYRLVPGKGYVQAMQYDTQKKYPSLDDSDKIDVLSPESPTIVKLLSRQ